MNFWIAGVFALCLVEGGYGREPSSSLFYNLKHEETNVRFGPGNQFPVKFFLRYPKLPVEVIKTHEDWYFIHDFEGEGGWIHKRMVSQCGVVMVTSKTPLKKEKKVSSPILAQLSKGVLVKLKECRNKLCKVEIKRNQKSILGWVPEKNLWGVNSLGH